MKKLLEAVTKFSGEEVEQKSSKELVGDSILKDLSKGHTPKTKEKELAEEWAAFSEENIGTHPKRPARKNARHSRGHEPQTRYKTVKADESAMGDKDIELQDYRSMSHKEFQTAYSMTKTEWINKNKSLVITNPGIKKGLGLDEGAEQDPIVATVVKQMRPGLTGLNMGNEAFLYFAYELGKQRARDSWSDYLPAIRAEYEKGLNEDANTDNKLAKLLTRFVDQNEGAARAVVLDAIEYIKKIGHIEQFATSLDYFGVDLDEGSKEDGPVEARWMVKLSDDDGDHLKTFHDKFPSLSAAKKAFKNTPYATDFKYKPVKKDQVEEAIDSDIVQPMGQDSINRAGYNPLRDERDYLDKLSGLSNLARKPGVTKQMQDQIQQRILDLNKAARAKGFTQVESRGHTVIANKLKDVERAKKFASGELKIPTPQERQAQLAKQKDKKEKVDEYGAGNPPQGTTITTPTAPQKVDPKQAQQLAQNLNVEKTALGQLKQLNPSINPQKAAMAATKDIATMNPQEKEVLAQVAKTLSPALGSPAFGSIKTALQKAKNT